jgi:beta-lactamase class A
MPPTRRAMAMTLLAAASLNGGLTGAGCAGRVNRRSRFGGLDLDRLAAGYVGLADRARPGTLGLGVMTLDTPAVWTADPRGASPLQSVFKAPLAAAALAEVDAGRLTLNEIIRIGPEDLSPPPSRLNRAFPPAAGKTLDVPVADLIALAVQESDNTAADSIMRRIGGPGAVTAWLRGRGIEGMRVDRYERELQPEIAGLASFRPAWKDEAAWAAARAGIAPEVREQAMAAYLADPRDTTSVQAALNFLNQLWAGALLSPRSTSLLTRLMTGAVTGQGRLRAGLPPGTVLAHKTGSAATDLGLTPATNDIGLATLPGGRRLAIVALLAGSTATESQRDALIADAARLAVSALR